MASRHSSPPRSSDASHQDQKTFSHKEHRAHKVPFDAACEAGRRRGREAATESHGRMVGGFQSRRRARATPPSAACRTAAVNTSVFVEFVCFVAHPSFVPFVVYRAWYD